jgi:hypothetical protein
MSNCASPTDLTDHRPRLPTVNPSPPCCMCCAVVVRGGALSHAWSRPGSPWSTPFAWIETTAPGERILPTMRERVRIRDGREST